MALIFLTLFGASIAMIFLREANINYPVLLAVKLVFISLFVYFGVKIQVITTENLSLLKNMLRGVRLQLLGMLKTLQ
jgi:hypothetical protein